MNFTCNSTALQGVTYNGNEVKSITYNGVEVWQRVLVYMDWTSDSPPKMNGTITDGVYAFDANNHDFHNWQIKYDGTSLIYLLDGNQVATVNPTDKRTTFYFSGGWFYSGLNCEIKNFCIYQ